MTSAKAPIGSSSVDLLVTSARVSDDRDLVDIAIAGERIVAIEPHIQADGVPTIDAAGRAVLPGFVEPHLHLDKALLYRRAPIRDGTLAEALRVTAELKAERNRDDVLERSRAVLDMAVANGTTAIRAHPDLDPIQGLLGVETGLALREQYRPLLDLQIVAFPQEGILRSPGTLELMEEAMRMGASVVGGCHYIERDWDDARAHIDLVFELAQRFGAPVDLHADFADHVTDPRYTAARYIAEKTIALGYQGRVSLGHATSLAALTPQEARPVVGLLSEAQVTVVALPSTDLYLGGRMDTYRQPRGVAPVRLLLEAGVNVTFSSNNVRNAFTPFGNADMLQIGSLLAHVAQLGTPADQAAVLRMATYAAARSIGLQDYGLGEGRIADLVVLDSPLIGDVLNDIPARLWVLKRGRVTVRTEHRTVISRDASGAG